MAISDAVGQDRVSTVLGYKLQKGNFSKSTPNLPQRILVLGVPNTANASGVTPNLIEQHLTAKSVGDRYGYGSPMHSVMRILKPSGSDGVGGIPVFFSSQAETGTATVVELTVTGTVTAAGSATVKVGGRDFLDGGSYGFSYSVGDNTDTIMGRIRDAVNSVVGSPYTAAFVSGTDTKVTFTSKFKGLNSNVSLGIDYGSSSNGLIFATNVTAGAGNPAVTTALNNIGDQWITMTVNTYSPESTAILTELQVFNGKPGDVSNGRYSGIIWRPLIAFTGVCTQSQLTAARAFGILNINEVTNSFAPAYGSMGSCYEAAANIALLQSVLANNAPHRDVIDQKYLDMPSPAASTMTLSMPSYDLRDSIVKDGVSTSSWNGSAYVIKDLVTTYHSEEDDTPVFRYVRDLYIDFNMKFSYFLKQQTFVIGKIIVPDGSAPGSSISQDVISPKIWKALVMDLTADFESRGMLADAAFSDQSIEVEIDPVNPNRLNTRFDYNRTGIVRIGSTNVSAGFYYGS